MLCERFSRHVNAVQAAYAMEEIMAAKKKTIEQKDLAAVGVAAQSAWSQVKDATPRPPREAGLKVNDEGSGGEALATFLAEKKLI